MRLVCEGVVKEVLPAVRSLVAKELSDKGYSQTEIAEILEITQPAVSQYLNHARGRQVQLIEENDEVYSEVNELVDMLLDDAPREKVASEFCEVCTTVREEEILEKVQSAREADCYIKE